MNGRELRVWHWCRYVAADASARIAEERAKADPVRALPHLEYMRSCDRRAKFHLDAVTTMDAHPECAGTRAYQDAEILPDRALGIQKKHDQK